MKLPSVLIPWKRIAERMRAFQQSVKIRPEPKERKVDTEWKMKRCQLHRTKTKFIVYTESKSDTGLYLADDPVYLLPVVCDVLELQNAIVDSLLKSRRNMPTPKRDEWAAWQKDLLKKMKQRSFTGLYKSSSSCLVEMNGNALIIYPEKLSQASRPSQGLVLVEEGRVEIQDWENNKDKLTARIIEILKC
jgi:hypothetical protein